jgi:hypothetical protein
MSGWIKIHRSITEHWLYTEKRCFSKFEAWNDILLTVNYSESKIIIKGKIYEIKRGESILSFESWGKRWNWDKSKVRRFFNLLQSDKMISLKCDNITTHLTICNYDNYQSTGNTDETQTKRESNTDETQVKPKGNTSEFQMKPIKESKEEEEEQEVKESKKPPKSKPIIEDIIFPFNSNEFNNSWNEWKEYKVKEYKFSYKSKLSELKTIQSLFKKSNGSEKLAIEMIDNAIANGWKGIYEIKNNNNAKQFTKPNANEALANRLKSYAQSFGVNQEQNVVEALPQRNVFDDYEEIP